MNLVKFILLSLLCYTSAFAEVDPPVKWSGNIYKIVQEAWHGIGQWLC